MKEAANCTLYFRITAVGVIFQTASYTFAMPVYLIVHLLTSPIALTPTAATLDAVVADAADIDLITVCIILTLVVPSILMALPSPGIVSVVSHYNWIAFWQGFPLWHGVFFYTLKFILPPTSKGTESASAACRAHHKSIVPVYRFALAFAVTSPSSSSP